MISVIVPIYNQELYLKNCIDSLLSQTYSDIEIILGIINKLFNKLTDNSL